MQYLNLNQLQSTAFKCLPTLHEMLKYLIATSAWIKINIIHLQRLHTQGTLKTENHFIMYTGGNRKEMVH